MCSMDVSPWNTNARKARVAERRHELPGKKQSGPFSLYRPFGTLVLTGHGSHGLTSMANACRPVGTKNKYMESLCGYHYAIVP